MLNIEGKFNPMRIVFLVFGLFALIHGFGVLSAQGVKISSSPGTPDSSAILELDASDRGFLIPRMSQVQRDAIVNPAVGLQIFNTTSDCVDMYFNSGWSSIHCGCSQSPSAQFNLSPNPAGTGNTVTATGLQPGSSNFQWSFASGNPSSGSGTSATSTWANPGSYQVSLLVTDSAGCSDSSSQTLVVNACSNGSQTLNYTGGLQTWTVPANACNVTILAEGAQGGNGQSGGTGGNGASIQGTFSNLNPGDVLVVVVGGRGNSGVSGNSARGGGGGGGSFVYTQANNTLLIAAGGGGGGGHNSGNGGHGQSGSSGGNGASGSAGGSNGNGGGIVTSNGYDGGGGAGWLSNGASNAQATGGRTRTNGWTGGSANAYNPLGVNGGFGGGGGAEHGAGGGGGYSGGGGGFNGSPYGAGGGGSFNGGSNQSNQSGTRTGHGRVVITWN